MVEEVTFPLDPESSATLHRPDSLNSDLNQALLRRGLIDRKDLELAIHYQKKMAERGHTSTLEQILVDLAFIDRATLDQVATEEAKANEAQSSDPAERIEQLVRLRTQSLEQQLTLARTADEIAQLAGARSSIYEAFYSTTSQIVDRYRADCAAIFILDDTGMRAILKQVTCTNGQDLTGQEYKTQVGSQCGVGQAAAKNQLVATGNISPIVHNASDYLLSEARSEVCLPIAIQEKVLGVLEVQFIKSNAFDINVMASLQSIANHLAPIIQHFQTQETTQTILVELSLLYQSSQLMTQAKTNEDILKHTAKILNQAQFISYILKAEKNGLRLIANHDPDSNEIPAFQLSKFFEISPVEIEHFLFIHEYLLTYELSPVTGMPESLRNLAKQLGCRTAAFVPIRKNSQLEALMVLGSKGGDALNHKTLQLYVSLANITSLAFERVQELEYIERRLNRLQILDSISQAITVETDLNHLYQVIHEQIAQVMGEIDFLIALYDPKTNMVEIPYACEENQLITIPSFELGDSLTSIPIRTKQPLLLGEDVEKRASELGARLIGKSAKSWLGVPLLVGGDVIGAIIVQDMFRESRFEEDDQRLLRTLATQVASTVRNARLIHETKLLAERESAAKEISNKLWTSSDIDSILRTAVYELGKNLDASMGFIQLELDAGEGSSN